MIRTEDHSTPTFAQLVERLQTAGLHVGLALCYDGHHQITVFDTAAARSIRMPVTNSFDQTAAILVMSMCLRESLGLADVDGHATRAAGHAIGRWPEFTKLWPELLAGGAPSRGA